jgi:hypothetical protein
MKLHLMALDITLRNCGIALGSYDLDTQSLDIVQIRTFKTEREDRKIVRANSDDLRCSRELLAHLRQTALSCNVVAAEIPSGSQSAAAAKHFGITTGILAALSLNLPLIEILPSETKKIIGKKNASKIEMIEWAYRRFPDLSWKIDKKTQRPTLNSEHMADAIAVMHAAIETQQFKQMIAMRRTLQAVAF